MKKILRISHYILLLGWFPFMFLAAFGANLSIGWVSLIVGLGVVLCMVGSISIVAILPEDEHLKAIEELRKAKEDYKKATNKLMGEFYQKMRDL